MASLICPWCHRHHAAPDVRDEFFPCTCGAAYLTGRFDDEMTLTHYLLRFAIRHDIDCLTALDWETDPPEAKPFSKGPSGLPLIQHYAHRPPLTTCHRVTVWIRLTPATHP